MVMVIMLLMVMMMTSLMMVVKTMAQGHALSSLPSLPTLPALTCHSSHFSLFSRSAHSLFFSLFSFPSLSTPLHSPHSPHSSLILCSQPSSSFSLATSSHDQNHIISSASQHALARGGLPRRCGGVFHANRWRCCCKSPRGRGGLKDCGTRQENWTLRPDVRREK